jgi:hypothetical protein
MKRLPYLAALAFAGLLSSSPASAGALFLTGHDPDFHAILPSGNATGARNINTTAIDFVTNGTFNPFTATTNKFLFVESRISPPLGHRNGVDGIVQSGYTNGVDFEHHDASTLAGELAQLGTKYNAIVIASDFGGVLTQAELDILNAGSTSIIGFLNAGGGLYAMAEGNSGAGLTPNGGFFGYLPFIVSSAALNQTETGVTTTSFGQSLGLTDADVNNNASHNIFTGTGGLNVVDLDAAGNILSLAGRFNLIDPGTGVVAEPAALVLFGLGLAGLGAAARRRKAA